MCLAVPGMILSIDEGDPLTRQGRVAFAGLIRLVHLGYVPEAAIGDYVLVHAGFAITVVDEAAAVQTLADLAAFAPDGFA